MNPNTSQLVTPTTLARIFDQLRRQDIHYRQLSATAYRQFDPTRHQADPAMTLVCSTEDWSQVWRSGALFNTLPMRFAGGQNAACCRIQAAFAEQGITPRFYPRRQELDLAPSRMHQDTDLVRLCRSFRRLREKGYFAVPCLAATPSLCCARAHQACGTQLRAAHWSFQAHRASFDHMGNLCYPLFLAWAGDKWQIAAALRAEKLSFEPPSARANSFQVLPTAARPSRTAQPSQEPAAAFTQSFGQVRRPRGSVPTPRLPASGRDQLGFERCFFDGH